MRLQFLPLLQRHGIGIYAYRSVYYYPKSGAKVRKICDIYKKNAKKHTKACTNSDLTRYLCML